MVCLLFDFQIVGTVRGGGGNTYIIITTDAWKEIALQLENGGLKLGENYLPYYIFDEMSYSSLYYLRRDFLNGKYLKQEFEWRSLLPDKKIAVVYGNCQTGVYRNALRLSCEFRENYVVIDTPEVWEYKSKPECVECFLEDKCFWKSVDLFIYQFVSRDNPSYGGWATECCMKKLNAACEKVAIVSLDFSGYFPQMGDLVKEESTFNYRDKYADDLMQKNMEVGEIIEILSDKEFLAEQDIESGITKSLLDLKKKDGYADVKIYDYIEENYKKEQLCYSPFHPCDDLIREYTKRLFQYLKLEWTIADEDFTMTNGAGIMKGSDLLIYPSVVSKLGLKKYNKRFCFNRGYVLRDMSLDFKRCMEIYVKSNRQLGT